MKTRWLAVFAVVWAALLIGGSASCAPAGRIDLQGAWKFQADPQNVGLKRAWQTPQFDASAWRAINVPGAWESQGVTAPNPNWKEETIAPYGGYAWYRRSVTIPRAWQGQKVFLNLGKIDDQDWAYFNGTQVGSYTTSGGAEVARSYEIPGEIVNFDRPNIIAVRVLDVNGTGGIVSGPVSLTLGEGETTTATAPAPQPPTPAEPAPGPTAAVPDSVNVGSDTVVEAGQTVHDAVAVRGDVIVRGHVTGDAVAVLGNIRVGSEGRVDGNVVTVMGNVYREPGSQVGGQATCVVGSERATRGAHPFRAARPVVIAILSAIGTAVLWGLLAAIIAALFPARMEMIASAVVERPGMSAVYGLIALLLIVPVAILLVLTCVGIPLVVVEILLIGAAWFMGKIGVGLALGRKLGDALGRPIPSVILAAVIGTVIITLVEYVPFVGWLLAGAVTFLGFGAVLMTVFGTHPDWWVNRRSRGRLAPPPGPEMPDVEGPSQ